mmetsp:Transcript_14536/g.34325  ORF Transcript_14536/g.34325 Transcript_14536/m.34325 type:complete len:230 (-) Transcript_14536:286-975(-)
MVKDTLRESLAARLLPQCSNKAEGLGNWQIGLHVCKGSAFSLRLLEDVAAAVGHHGVNATQHVLWTSDLNEEDRLLQRRHCCHLRCEAAAAHGWHHLSGAAVGLVGVEHHVHDVEAHSSQALLAERSLLRGPLEGAVNGVPHLSEIWHRLRLVHHDIGTLCLGAEAPKLLGSGILPTELVPQDSSTLFRVSAGPSLAIFDAARELLGQRLRHHIDAVVLVGRLGQAVQS